MQRLRQDRRFRACRLMKQPGFILMTVLTMALGTGFTQIKTTGVVLFQRTVVVLSFYVLSLLIVKVSRRGDRRRDAV
jgi:hypothetical protein